MYIINKIVGFLTSPLSVACLGVLLALVLRFLGRRRGAGWVMALGVAWAWAWATPLMTRIVGAPLERPYLVGGRVPALEAYPQADIIELHGGSMALATNICARGEMCGGADRVWMAARLWKAGKAPKIYVTGGEVEATTKGLLEDFGVPTNALVFSEAPRNTEEEAKLIASTPNTYTSRPKVLVVTSAWHMRRTMLMYEKYAPEVEAIPVPCDFENTLWAAQKWTPLELLPNHYCLMANVVSVHEWVGIWGYKMLR